MVANCRVRCEQREKRDNWHITFLGNDWEASADASFYGTLFTLKDHAAPSDIQREYELATELEFLCAGSKTSERPPFSCAKYTGKQPDKACSSPKDCYVLNNDLRLVENQRTPEQQRAFEHLIAYTKKKSGYVRFRASKFSDPLAKAVTEIDAPKRPPLPQLHRPDLLVRYRHGDRQHQRRLPCCPYLRRPQRPQVRRHVDMELGLRHTIINIYEHLFSSLSQLVVLPNHPIHRGVLIQRVLPH